MDVANEIRALKEKVGRIAGTKSHSHDFLDNFDDASIYWAWRLHNTDANRTIVEAGGVLTIAHTAIAANFDNIANSAPKVIIGIRGFPITIIVKVNSYTVNDDTIGGIAFSDNIIGVSPNFCYVARVRNEPGMNGITAYIHGFGHTYVANTTMPVWFRVRVNAEGRYGTKWIYDYSHDGSAYTNFLTRNDPIASRHNLAAALLCANWSTNPAQSVPFESFRMTPSYGPG